MTESMLDTLRRLIVGRRGRGRADRLIVTTSNGETREVEIKAQRNARTYVELIEQLSPVRIEAFAGKTLVGVWGETMQPANDAAPPRAARKAASAPGAPEEPTTKKKKKGSLTAHDVQIMAMQMAKEMTTHMNSLLASAYRGAADRDMANFASLANIAQTHADRAANSEARLEDAQKSIRIRDRAINEQNAAILKLSAKLNEVAAESDEEKKTTMLFELLKTINGGKGAGVVDAVAAAAGAKTNGAAKKGKPS